MGAARYVCIGLKRTANDALRDTMHRIYKGVLYEGNTVSQYMCNRNVI